MSKPTIVFSPFPKLRSGDDDPGSSIVVNGEREGVIVRNIDWRDVGSVSVSYRATIFGYTVQIFSSDPEPSFKTLAGARDYVRKFFTPKA